MKALILLLLPLNALAAGKIVNADIAASGTANIARNKMAAGTPYDWCVNDVSGFVADTAVTASRAVATDANGAPVASATTAAELGFVNGVTSAIQTQLNGKQASGNYITALTGDVTASGPGSVAATVAKIQGTAVSGTTGTNNVVFSGAPTLTNPIVGTQTQADNSTKAASTAYVDTGLATKASSTLTAAHIFAGNVSSVATDVAVSGDLTMDNAGAFTIGNGKVTAAKLANTAVTPGSYTSTNLTVDQQGRITAASSGGGGGASAMSVLTKTSGYTILTGDFNGAAQLMLEANCSSACTITFPAASNSGYMVSAINVGAATATLATAGSDTFGSNTDTTWILPAGGDPQSSNIFIANGGTRWDGF